MTDVRNLLESQTDSNDIEFGNLRIKLGYHELSVNLLFLKVVTGAILVTIKIYGLDK